MQGALCPEGALRCVQVYFFNVHALLELPPGAWLLRVRLKFMMGHQNVRNEHLSLLTRSQQPGVYVTPVPEELARNVSPGAGSQWTLSCDTGLKRVATTVECLTKSFGSVPAGGDAFAKWCFRPAAVVHVRGVEPGNVHVRLFKISDMLWIRNVCIDCIQAVPLHDEMRWPVNGASALEGRDQVLGQLVNPELGTAHCLTVPV